MNKRSKSSTNVSILVEKLANKTVQYEQLQSKVNKSKPILQTIYNKVKLKESLYERKLQKSKKHIIQSKQIARQYKKLFQDGLRIMQKSKIMDKSRYEGNYMKNYDKTVKSKSIYEQYRQRIEKGKYGKVEKSREELKNPEVKKLCEKSKQISQDMKNEIDKLRLVRSKSQKCMGKSKSSIILKRAVIYEEKEDKALKDKFIQKQKQKFSKI